jgi:hypothetical protein
MFKKLIDKELFDFAFEFSKSFQDYPVEDYRSAKKKYRIHFCKSIIHCISDEPNPPVIDGLVYKSSLKNVISLNKTKLTNAHYFSEEIFLLILCFFCSQKEKSFYKIMFALWFGYLKAFHKFLFPKRFARMFFKKEFYKRSLESL